jgi:hypothetical protein
MILAGTAMLCPEPTGWELRNLGSKNGVRVEGSLAARSTLQAGAKIQLRGLTLVADSLKFIGLRSLLSRLVGWAPERQADVDGRYRTYAIARCSARPWFYSVTKILGITITERDNK